MDNATMIIALAAMSFTILQAGQALVLNPEQKIKWGKALRYIAIIPLILIIILFVWPQLTRETWTYIILFGVMALASWIATLRT